MLTPSIQGLLMAETHCMADFMMRHTPARHAGKVANGRRIASY